MCPAAQLLTIYNPLSTKDNMYSPWKSVFIKKDALTKKSHLSPFAALLSFQTQQHAQEM